MFSFQLLFGTDGYLYIFVGDGGGAGDPNNNAQDKWVNTQSSWTPYQYKDSFPGMGIPMLKIRRLTFNMGIPILVRRHFDIETVLWCPLLGVLSGCPIFKSSHCNSLDDWAPVDFIYGCPIFKWVAETWLHEKTCPIESLDTMIHMMIPGHWHTSLSLDLCSENPGVTGRIHWLLLNFQHKWPVIYNFDGFYSVIRFWTNNVVAWEMWYLNVYVMSP